MPANKPKQKPKYFKTQTEFRTWLRKNHKTSNGIWVGFWKKSSGKGGLNYDQALDEALCYGWIDSQANSIDEKSYVQRFTPRRSKSVWSKINRKHIARLIKTKKMRAAGLAQVKEAKKNGRWKAAY